MAGTIVINQSNITFTKWERIKSYISPTWGLWRAANKLSGLSGLGIIDVQVDRDGLHLVSQGEEIHRIKANTLTKRLIEAGMEKLSVEANVQPKQIRTVLRSIIRSDPERVQEEFKQQGINLKLIGEKRAKADFPLRWTNLYNEIVISEGMDTVPDVNLGIFFPLGLLTGLIAGLGVPIVFLDNLPNHYKGLLSVALTLPTALVGGLVGALIDSLPKLIMGLGILVAKSAIFPFEYLTLRRFQQANPNLIGEKQIRGTMGILGHIVWDRNLVDAYLVKLDYEKLSLINQYFRDNRLQDNITMAMVVKHPKTSREVLLKQIWHSSPSVRVAAFERLKDSFTDSELASLKDHHDLYILKYIIDHPKCPADLRAELSAKIAEMKATIKARIAMLEVTTESSDSPPRRFNKGTTFGDYD